MKTAQVRLAEAVVPPGPTERFHSSEDFFSWLGENIAAYGGLYKAFVHGIPVYVVSAPEYVEQALSRCRAASAKCRRLRNCQAAATAVRHVSIAAARSVRCVWADVRWRWTLNVL